MTIEEVQARLIAMHDPTAHETPGHQYEVWNDGEITTTKAGDLFRARTLHMLRPGNPDINMDLPIKDRTFSRVMIKRDVTYEELTELLKHINY